MPAQAMQVRVAVFSMQVVHDNLLYGGIAFFRLFLNVLL